MRNPLALSLSLLVCGFPRMMLAQESPSLHNETSCVPVVAATQKEAVNACTQSQSTSVGLGPGRVVGMALYPVPVDSKWVGICKRPTGTGGFILIPEAATSRESAKISCTMQRWAGLLPGSLVGYGLSIVPGSGTWALICDRTQLVRWKQEADGSYTVFWENHHWRYKDGIFFKDGQLFLVKQPSVRYESKTEQTNPFPQVMSARPVNHHAGLVPAESSQETRWEINVWGDGFVPVTRSRAFWRAEDAYRKERYRMEIEFMWGAR